MPPHAEPIVACVLLYFFLGYVATDLFAKIPRGKYGFRFEKWFEVRHTWHSFNTSRAAFIVLAPVLALTYHAQGLWRKWKCRHYRSWAFRKLIMDFGYLPPFELVEDRPETLRVVINGVKHRYADCVAET